MVHSNYFINVSCYRFVTIEDTLICLDTDQNPKESLKLGGIINAIWSLKGGRGWDPRKKQRYWSWAKGGASLF
mgnify:CR=1 FL=1